MHDLSQYAPLVNTIFQISQKYKKHYCFPSQETLQKHLSKIYNITRSNSTINRWLRRLEDNRIFKRVRRIQRMPNNQIQFRSTMYFIKKKGMFWLHRLGYDVWDVLSKWYADSARLRTAAAAARKKTQEGLISWAEYKRLTAANQAASSPDG